MATPDTIRVRFAPSPTGYLHTGGARTALFNWLWAKQSGGQFILRIEDTDELRSTEESTRKILDGLRWLGLDWDEGPDADPARFGESIGDCGPYFQSKRAERHLELVKQLLAEGQAFYCPATAEEMTDADGKKKNLSPYRDLSPEEQQARLAAAGGQLPIRFKCPLGKEVAWDDVVRGRVSFKSDEIGDFIFVKSNGLPLYNFAVTCDDADMRITHVLRGEDHISNTPKQIMLYRALGLTPPLFGHAPLIVGMDGARLSKRHGATQVGAYREMGILPEAMVNFLLLIGWAPKDNKELFTRQEMLDYFNPADINKAAGAFNPEKLHHFNGLYIRSLAPAELLARLKPFMPAEWLEFRGEEYAGRVVALYQEKLTFLNEIEGNAWYFFRDPQETDYNEATVAKFLTSNDEAGPILGDLFAEFSALSEDEWDEQHLAPPVDALCERLGLGKGKVMQPWRVALTGDKISPGFFDLLVVLGRETVLGRVKPWINRLN
ncbi:glutamate--tRNA ligase [bacterium]|nr:glutamate--tRNA ligase [bacterium]